MQRACDFLARREHSRAELRRKLLRSSEDTELVDELLDKLSKEKLQSDDRFVENFVHYRANNGHGPLKIQQELKQKGVDEETIQHYLSNPEYDWAEIAQGVREKKFGEELPNEYKDKAKQSRFLYGRGFDTELINIALSEDYD